MIIRKILVAIFLLFLSFLIFLFFFWEIPAPTKIIEKTLDVHRLNKYEQN